MFFATGALEVVYGARTGLGDKRGVGMQADKMADWAAARLVSITLSRAAQFGKERKIGCVVVGGRE